MKLHHVITLLFCFLLIAAPCIAQDTGKAELPATVKSSFEKIYPGATIAEWKLKKNGAYAIEFTHDGLKREAEFTADGKWLFTEREIKTTEIPEPVSKHLKASEWASWEIDKASELSSPEKEKYYEIKVEQRDNKIYLYYLPDGTLIEKSPKSKS